jgi:S1-C subfamily serine protease
MEYDRQRGLLGFPVDYEMGRTLHAHGQVRSKAIYDATKSYVVKIECKNAAGEVCSFFNGFFYHDVEPYIITAGHIIGFKGANQYALMLFDGTNLSEQFALKVLKFDYAADVAVFRCEERLPHPLSSRAAPVSIADTVYVVGFRGSSDAQLTLNEGKVALVSFDSTFLTSAYADEGFSGAPVFNMDGQFVGMVKSGEGQAIKQVLCVGAPIIHDVLTSAPDPLPGLH